MALKITKASDPIEVRNLTLCLYSPPGLGKTSMGFTADEPILLDFDSGAYRSQFRRDSVQVTSWGDVESITADDLAPYRTVIVDTAGRALDVLTAHIIAANPKFKGFGGALSLQGYGALKSAFISWLKLLHSFGKDVVLIAHSDEQRNGDEIIERLDVQGGSKAEIYKCADAMGRIMMRGGQRLLSFDPSDAAFGKNPAQLTIQPVPHFAQDPHFLAGVIASIKGKLNAAGEAAIAEQARVEALRADLMQLETANDFNAKIKAFADASPKDKAILVAIAGEKGLIFDKKAKVFTAEVKAAA